MLAHGSFDAGGGLPGPGDEHPQAVGDRKAGLGGCQRGRRTALEQPPQQCRVPAPGKRIRAGLSMFDRYVADLPREIAAGRNRLARGGHTFTAEETVV
ncbi:hypothetical protein Vlu01_34760 [Micromonospora lutea]|uniref:Uncharacterized protein n=1 Tax=Micromonospora lutea TaxID=419825 RepID=A0ABQ4IY61_9ACTN|nr:hypothetical protein Vlu01_34760 [Micromonospora lutea]